MAGIKVWLAPSDSGGEIIVDKTTKIMNKIGLGFEPYVAPLLTIPSFSEAGQDAWVCEKLIKPTFRKPNIYRGTFLDIGSNDPFYNNNSYALELLGWTGWLVDFDHDMCELCKWTRTNTVLEADARKVDWVDFLKTNKIDYLSLDVHNTKTENNVVAILKNLLPVVTFKVMTIEHDSYEYGEEFKKNIRDLVSSFGYIIEVEDVGYDQPFEDWWVRA